jgi:hypothetical protein
MASLSDFAIWPVLAASDPGRAKKWYEEKLGLTPKREDETGGMWYEFAGGTWLLMYPTPNAGTAKNTQAHFEVTDLESLVDTLRSRGRGVGGVRLRGDGEDRKRDHRSHGVENGMVQGQRGQHLRDRAAARGLIPDLVTLRAGS